MFNWSFCLEWMTRQQLNMVKLMVNWVSPLVMMLLLQRHWLLSLKWRHSRNYERLLSTLWSFCVFSIKNVSCGAVEESGCFHGFRYFSSRFNGGQRISWSALPSLLSSPGWKCWSDCFQNHIMAPRTDLPTSWCLIYEDGVKIVGLRASWRQGFVQSSPPLDVKIWNQPEKCWVFEHEEVKWIQWSPDVLWKLQRFCVIVRRRRESSNTSFEHSSITQRCVTVKNLKAVHKGGQSSLRR